MPYKDPQRKKVWEHQHRAKRLARRQQLRQIEANRQEPQPEIPQAQIDGTGLLFPLFAGGSLAAYDPKLAIGAGGLTLVLAALYKKGWSWWIVGLVILAMGLFFQWSDEDGGK